MMDESSTLLHRRKEESVCYTCVRVHMRVLREPPLIALARLAESPRIAATCGGNILECHALEKSAADPNEASWEYGVLISAKTGAGGTRDSGERPRGGTENSRRSRESAARRIPNWCATHSRCAAGRMKRCGRGWGCWYVQKRKRGVQRDSGGRPTGHLWCGGKKRTWAVAK